MPEKVLKLDERDNAVVALVTLEPGTLVRVDSPSSPASCIVAQTIPAKHKMALTDLKPGHLIYLYGMVVAEAVEFIERGGLLTTRNVRHRAEAYSAVRQPAKIAAPDASAWAERGFLGYHRADGQVGTRNYWLVLPLVFCENRNVDRMREALEEELGYGASNSYRQHVRRLIEHQANGDGRPEMVAHLRAERVFANLDGIRFLTVQTPAKRMLMRSACCSNSPLAAWE